MESKGGDHSHSACHSSLSQSHSPVLLGSNQQKPCCETGLEQKLVLKTKLQFKKRTRTSEFISKPKIIQDNFKKDSMKIEDCHLPLCLSSSSAQYKICKNPSKTVWDFPTLITAARIKHTKLSNKRRKKYWNRKIQLPSTYRREIFNFVSRKTKTVLGKGRKEKTEDWTNQECWVFNYSRENSKEEWELHALQN